MGVFTKAVQVLARNLGLTSPELMTWVSGGQTDTGETVSVDSSLQIGTVWACVRLIAQSIATLPLHVYQKAGDAAEVAKNHPLERLLHDRPNADMTANEMWTAVAAHILLWGNAYIAITRNGIGRIVALTPMRPDRIALRVERDGSITYVYTWNGQTQTLRAEDVLHIKGFTLDGYIGMSTIEVARNNIGAVRASERASAAIFRNGMRPSGIAKAPEYLSPEHRDAAKKILENFKGAHNTGSVPLLEGGWDFVPLSIPPNDAQMLETRNFHVEELCRWFDVPPIMIGHVGSGTTLGSSTEQMMLHFYRTCLVHHVERIEQALNGKLFTPNELSQGLYAEFNINSLLRSDHAGRAAYYSTMVQNGLMSRNEVRALENLPAKPDADDLTVQSNLTTLKNLTAPPAPAPGQLAITKPQNGSSTPIPEIRQ